MSKLYFRELCKEIAYPKEYILEEMKKYNKSEIIVYEQKRELKTDYYFCKAVGEVGEKDDGTCGIFCGTYQPRNGKSGCCKHRGFCYEPGEKMILIASGKLKKI